MMRSAIVAFGLLAIGLLGFAGYRFATDDEPPLGESLAIHEPDRDLGAQPCPAVIPVRFRLTNGSSRSIRVFGLVPG